MITRHYLTVGGRRIHYRKAGNGPPLVLAHQSPRSSAEYEPLIRQWAAHFTCIAPDTPGFGQSDPLPADTPDIDHYADALAAFIRALGLQQTAAYGFHSGGIILVSALRRHPDLFAALAVGGYAIWTPEEMALFGDRYLPPFLPSAYGEHLTWLWNRILEQSWFFPWFDVRDEARLSVAHDDPHRVHETVLDMLDAGNAYAAGYGSVLRAPRDIPPPDAHTPPVFISAYDGDPLQAHIDRLGSMPARWSATKVATPAEHHQRSLAFLLSHAEAPAPALAEDANAGFLPLDVPGFSGLVHWQGRAGSDTLALHAPGGEAALVDADDAIRIDLPGHGLSSGWPGAAPTDRNSWMRVIDAVAGAMGTRRLLFAPLPKGEPAQLFPDLRPDRHGAYLSTAWNIVRARHFFDPWYRADAQHAIRFDPAALAPERLAREHRALVRATAARAMMIALSTGDDDDNS
jgi:pimeloyl-ACP methyl ester carboxylesterase